jgi:hypothetical protein
MAKEILYRIEFEGAKQQLDNLDQIAQELAKIKIAQDKLRLDDTKSNAQKQRESELLKGMAAERQQAMQRERRAITDQQKAYRANAGTLEDLRLKAKKLGQELERGPVVGTKEFKRLSDQLRDVNDKIRTADKSAGNFKSSIGNYKDALSGLGGALGTTLSVGALVAFGNKALAAYDAQIKAETALLTALKGRVDVQKRLLDQASTLQGKTLFGDEVTIQAQAFAASMGLATSQIIKLIPAAQNLATVTGVGLEQAVQQLGKTYSGTAGRLSTLVPEVANLTKEQLKAGGAIDLVNKLMAGQAEAAALVGSGPMQQAKNVWGDFLEILGEVIATNTSGFFKSLTRELQGLNTVLASETIPLYQKLYSLVNPAAREELRIKEEIIKKRREEIGQSNQLRIDALEIGWKNIEDGKALLKLNKEQREESEKQAKLDREKAAEAAAKAAAAATKQLIAEMQKLNEEVLKLVPSWGEITTIARKGTKDALNAVLDGYQDTLNGIPGRLKKAFDDARTAPRPTLDIEESVPDEIDTAKVVSKLNDPKSFGTEQQLEAASQFVNIWQDAYTMQSQSRQAALDQQLQAGLISEKEYNKKVGKLKADQAKKDKTAALIGIAINTAQSIIKTGADLGYPTAIPFQVIAGILGAAQAAIVASQPIPKYATGGLVVGGNSHATGGTKFVGSDGSQFEAERDEVLAIVNKHDSRTLRTLSDINSRHGKSFYGQPRGSYFASGGVFQPNKTIGNVDTAKMIRDIVSQVGAIPVEVSLNEIENKAATKRKVNVIGAL